MVFTLSMGYFLIFDYLSFVLSYKSKREKIKIEFISHSLSRFVLDASISITNVITNSKIPRENFSSLMKRERKRERPRSARDEIGEIEHI